MKIYNWLTLGAAIVVVVLEAFLFARASTDDIGAPRTSGAMETTATNPSPDRAAPFTPGDTP
jgi:hypothetical protein